MKEPVLDSNLLPEQLEKPKALLINWTSIILLWIGIGLCAWKGLLTTTPVLAAAALLVVSTLATHFRYALGVKITFAVIGLGMFHLLTFFHIKIEMGIDLGMLIIGIIHYYTNHKVLGSMIKGMVKGKTPSLEQIEKTERHRIEGFKKKFSRKSDEELAIKISDGDILPEARTAAKEIIEDRKS